MFYIDHSYSPCLAEQLGDTGTGHSPIYGFAFDSYPIYGPYQSAGTLAKPCWKKRDYSNTSPTGCSDGKRSCLLVNMWDYTQGVTAASSIGPNTTTTVKTQSSNRVNSASGIYYEDYYYDSTCGAQGGEYLNEFNGHDHDNLGFHYHTTIDANLRPVFPYIVGPKYYGCIRGGTCSTTLSVGAGGGGGGSSASSSCATSSAVTLVSQQCTSYSFQSNFTSDISSTPSSLNSNEDSQKGLSVQNIAIIVGVVGGVVVLLFLSSIWYFCSSVSAGGYDSVAAQGRVVGIGIETVASKSGSDVEMAPNTLIVAGNNQGKL